MKYNLKTNIFIIAGFLLIIAIFLTQNVTFYSITLTRIFNGIIIVIGIYILGRLFWMCYYEYKYGKGAGELYLKYGKIFNRKCFGNYEYCPCDDECNIVNFCYLESEKLEKRSKNAI